MRLAIAFDAAEGHAAGRPDDAVAVRAVMDSVGAIEAASRELGWETVRIPVAGGPSTLGRGLLDALDAARPDVVFNLVESVGGEARLEAAAAWLLELSGIPYTGAPPLALSLALDKPVAKAVLASRGVPVAPGVVMERGDEPLGGLRAPWIVKPSREDASHGIDAGSVVDGEDALRRRVRWVLETYRQPALVEELVEGRELNVAILGHGDGARVLPLVEIDFSLMPAGLPRIVTHAAKWDEGSVEDLGSRPVDAALADADAASVRACALAAHAALGLRDYARVDLRLHPGRGPIVLEANPNPDLAPRAGFARAAARAGLGHVEVVEHVVGLAARRRRAPA